MASRLRHHLQNRRSHEYDEALRTCEYGSLADHLRLLQTINEDRHPWLGPNTLHHHPHRLEMADHLLSPGQLVLP
jgi:hypothetical protein